MNSQITHNLLYINMYNWFTLNNLRVNIGVYANYPFQKRLSMLNPMGFLYATHHL